MIKTFKHKVGVFFIVDKSHKKDQTNNALVSLSILPEFPGLSVALSAKPFASYWRRKSLKTAHKYIASLTRTVK